MRNYIHSNLLRSGAVLAAILLVALVGSVLTPWADTGQRKAYVLTIDDAIGPATRDHIVRNITRAERDGAEV
ncbi:MAG: nodulation protein NfeD, partial [Proteobacteria bacterium]|nr:nodulation protein NfeD [Pseudomonadota bacterium]